MDYAWVSGVVILVILAILVLGWLPRRTADSMKRVVEHREDKYSPSLHLVDADSGTRFSDERQPSVKGIVMQSKRKSIVASPSGASVARPTKAMKERARVAHIRQLRREAARRRAIISAALLLITIVVLAVSFPLKFSPLFALIPAALLAIVVALGVRTANHARAWERDLKAKRAAQSKAHQNHQNHRNGSVAVGVAAAKSDTQVASKASQTPVSSDEQPTGLMAEQEIQKAMKQTRAEKERIENRRTKAQAKNEQKIAAARSKAKNGDVSAVSKQTDTDRKTETKSGNKAKRSAAVQGESKTQPKSQSSSKRGPNQQAEGASASMKKKTSQSSNDTRQNVAADGSGRGNSSAGNQPIEPNDATNELKQVHPAQALDLVDLAPNQDLISFSLGAPRNGVEVKSEEPKSLEIKSTRQVAKATATAKEAETGSSSVSKRAKKSADRPPEDRRGDSDSSLSFSPQAEADQAEGSGRRLISKKNRKRVRAAAKRARAAAQLSEKDEKATYTSDPEKFHASEVSADTEAPAVSSDSLGTGLEKILERRNV